MEPTLRIGDALGYGIDRLATRGGAILLGAYVLFQVVTQVNTQSLFAGLFTDTLPAEQLTRTYPLAIDLPVTVSAGLALVLLIAGTVLAVVAMRALYSDIDSVPTADHTRRLVRTVAVMIVVSVITFFATLIGTVFFIVPGIFLAVSLVFAQLTVVLEDAGVVEALQRSWSLTAGNRIRLFVLGVIVFVLGAVVNIVFTALGTAYPLAGGLVSAVVLGVLSLFSVAVLVGAYRQLATASQTTSSAGPVTA